MFIPLHDRVLVRRIEGDNKTSGGLIIPENVKEKPHEGGVAAVGTGARDKDGTVSPWTSRPATESCSANGRAPKSSWMARFFLS